MNGMPKDGSVITANAIQSSWKRAKGAIIQPSLLSKLEKGIDSKTGVGLVFENLVPSKLNGSKDLNVLCVQKIGARSL